MAVTPLQAATDVLDRADALLALDKTGTPPATRLDIRRMALAMGLAAIDTQLHWLVRRADLSAALPRRLAEVEVDFGDLVDMAKTSVLNRKTATLDRPQTRARNVLNEAILRMTFQSARQVESALAMVGVAKPWRKLGAAMTPPEPWTAVTDRLNKLAHRRNLIVHEGDLLRMLRPQTIKTEKIEATFVTQELAWIRRFIVAVDSIT